MLTTAVVLYLIAALGLAAFAAKYLFGPAPADYHAEILQAGKVELVDTIKRLFRAVNLVFGSLFLSLALCTAVITIFGVSNDIFWAKLLVPAIACIGGISPTLVGYRMEQHTGVKTPWRPGAILTVIVPIAFIFSML